MADETGGAPKDAFVAPPYCDVIMKGGTASAIVYPPLLAGLVSSALAQEDSSTDAEPQQDSFELRNLAGTSAGSIGAVLGAAAEYRRQKVRAGEQTGDPLSGFKTLSEFPAVLDEAGGILPLFQPWAETKLVWDLLWALKLGKGFKGKVCDAWQVFQPHWRWLAGGGILGLLVARLCWLPGRGDSGGALASAALLLLAAVVCGLFKCSRLAVPVVLIWLPVALAKPPGSVVLALLTGLVLLPVCGHLYWLVVKVLPRKCYGVCPGGTLTNWLATEIDKVAGKEGDELPLTFHDYEHCRADGESQQLRMVTTCLTQGRPYFLPFRQDVWWFDPAQLNDLMGAELVAKLVKLATRDQSTDEPVTAVDRAVGPPLGDEDVVDSAARPASGCVAWQGHLLYALPTDDLPVAVGMRLSMALPGVLCAVPLWERRFERSADGAGWTPVFKQAWFTDGGVTANLPVHFFDVMVPRWPTVTINLDYATTADDPGDVYLAKSNLAGQSPRRQPLENVWQFGMGLLDTMRNWHDNTQLTAPGQRDRLATIRLSQAQGGMNLNMSLATMEQVARRSRQAATLLVQRFRTPDGVHKLNWRNHRWIRLVTASKLLETSLGQYLQAESASPSYGDLCARAESYQACEPAARVSVPALLKVRPVGAITACSATPKPPCELQVRPEL